MFSKNILQKMSKLKILIVGGGPVGLASALFLSSISNIELEIIEQATERKNILESKALSVNPRTLTLLTGYKAQQKIIANSIKLNKFKLKTSQKSTLENDIGQTLKGKTQFPHLCIYPQNGTENILEEELNERRVYVRRGVKLQKILKNEVNHVVVKLSDSELEKSYNIVLAADGARSTVRKCLQIPFPGETLSQKIYLADYEIDGKPRDFFQANIGNPQTFIVVPVAGKVVRLVGNFPELETYAEKVCKMSLGKKIWESSFQLNNRHVQNMNVGGVYLAGDAAHVHAPIGGRGMNLGIEDVFVFAELLKAGRLSEYSSLRVPVIREFVETIKRASKALEYKKTIIRSILPYVGPALNYFAKQSMVLFAAGLDHEVPFTPKL